MDRARSSRRRGERLRTAVGALGALAILAVTATARAQVPKAGANWAVIVGLDYNWSDGNRLRFTLSDAHRFQHFLNAPPENTVFLSDDEDATGAGGGAPAARATRDNVLQAIRRLAARAKPEDTFWFYFSGHGLFEPESESSFLIPADVRKLTTQTGISVRDLRTLLADPAVCKAHTKILVLDACESGSSRKWHTVDENGAATGGADSAATTPYAPLPGVMTFAAARPDRGAWETEQSPIAGGIFTYYLCCGLAGDGVASADHPVVTLSALQKYVVSHVDDLCDHLGHLRQEPVFLAAAPADGGNTARDPGAIPISRFDPAALARLQPAHAADSATLSERPRLEPGVILVVDAANREIQKSVQTALQQALIERGIALYSADVAPEFVGVLKDPKRTEEAARRLSARLLLRVHVEATSSPSTVVAGMASSNVTLHATLTDVYGVSKAAADADSGNSVSGDSQVLIRQTFQEEIKTAVKDLTSEQSDLLATLPKRRQ